jgi:hypothetical protein
MNKMNLFALLVVFGVLANLAFSLPQRRVTRWGVGELRRHWQSMATGDPVANCIDSKCQ